MNHDWQGCGSRLRSIATSGVLIMAIAGFSAAQDDTQLRAGAPHAETSTDLIAKADSVFNAREYEAAGEVYKQAAVLAEGEGQRANQVEALAQVARCFSIRGLGDQGLPWLEQAGALADTTAPRGWARYEIVRGAYQREDGYRAEATDTFARLYDFCRAHGLHRQAVNAAHMAAIAAEPEQQIAWALAGIRAAEEGAFEGWLAVLWNNLGWTYDDLGRYSEALDALTKARDYHWKTGDDQAKLIADWSVGHALRKVHRLDEAHVLLQNVMTWAQRRYAEDPSPSSAEWVGMGHKELGELALDEGRRNDALREFTQALEKLREAGMEAWDADGLRALSEQVRQLEE